MRLLLRRVPLLLIGSTLFTFAHPAFAATSDATKSADTALAAATVALQNQDYRGAIRLLEPAMTALNGRAGAWRSLGFAHLKLHESGAAQTAYTKALAVEPDNLQPLLYLGIAAAQLGQREQALEWLRKARDSRRIDMTQLEVEPDLQVLRSDPSFAELLPRPEDFARPFVEDVHIIREWQGEAAGDQFGWIARLIGDVDGDGVNDFVTSAPTKNIRGENAGRIYVYSGRNGALLWSADGAPGDQLGNGIEAAGDTNGDGIPDVVGGAPAIDTAYVYSGRDGRVLLTLHGEAKGDNFGDHVASAGDFNGDGYADIIVGAPANNAQGKGAGRAYVYSGRDGRLLLTLSGRHAGDAFGSTVAGYADKAQRFLVVGAPGAGPQHKGRVYVYRNLSAQPAFVIDADSSGVALGYMFVSVLGDVDGDGVPDIFASDWSDASKGPGTGKTYIYSGRTGRRLYILTGETAGEGFGTTQSVAGDVNGDGRADLIIGAWQYSAAAQSGGRAYLYDGRNGRLLRTYTCRIPGDTFGFDAVGLGAVDDAGQAELLITSGWSGVHGHHSGRIFLISSGVRPVGDGAPGSPRPRPNLRAPHRRI
jgi:FG-GAP repeat/FG-GAP-like repeat